MVVWICIFVAFYCKNFTSISHENLYYLFDFVLKKHKIYGILFHIDFNGGQIYDCKKSA